MNRFYSIFIVFLVFTGCKSGVETQRMDITADWKFKADEKNTGLNDQWYKTNLKDADWVILQAGDKWENQGFKELDSFGWYRKEVLIPKTWKGKKIWLKFEAVNDAYELFVNGVSVSIFGQANISVAARPTYTEISKNLKYGENNLIALRVEDFGGSGGLWRAPIVLTTREADVKNLFKPMDDKKYFPEEMGYQLVWEDQFNGTGLDEKKWMPRSVGPRACGYISEDAIKVKNGNLELWTFTENDSIKVGAVGTQETYMTTYGFFECRAQMQKSGGNWSAFWIQSPGIAKGEDPGIFGTEIDIFEFFKKDGADMVSHNLHWAYGPNQQSIGARLSHHGEVSKGFHTFAVEWTPEKYAFYIDGYKYYEIKQAISHTDEYMILSMELPGKKEDMRTATLPDFFLVDYVRVYKK